MNRTDDANPHIDETDRRLVALLAEDARTPAATLARRLGLARTTVQARIERLLARGVISGFTLRAGPRLSAPIRATAMVSVEPRSGPGVLARLESLPQVRSVHTTSGRVDFIVELAADTTEELDETLDRIGEAKGVRSSESLVHLSTKLDRRV